MTDTNNKKGPGGAQRPSRREAKRQAKRLADERAAQQRLDDDLEAELERYRFSEATTEEWAAVRPVLLDVMRRSHIRGKASLVRHLSVVAKFLTHQHRIGSNLETSFTVTKVDHYYLHGMTSASARTRNDYRSRLLQVAKHVAPEADAPVRAPSLGHRSVRPGYNDVEVAQICRVALRQRKPLRRRQLCAIVGLAMGAGLSSADLRWLRAGSIADHGDGGIEIDVPGSAARVVWVRRTFEHLVRIGIEGLDPEQLVIGEQVDRRNITTGIFAHVENFDAPDLDASRMRSTWLMWLLVQRVPIQIILTASGLKTARTLSELIEFLDEPDDDPAAIMRGEDR